MIYKHRNKHIFTVKSATWLSITTVGLNQVYAYKKKLVYSYLEKELLKMTFFKICLTCLGARKSIEDLTETLNSDLD